MISLGDKIRDAIVDKYRKGDEPKAAAMERAAGLLKISKSNLYGKLNTNPIPVDILEKIQKILGIDIAALRGEQESEATGQQSTDGKCKFLTIPIKNHKVVKVYLPEGYDKEDLKTIREHVNLWEKTL